MSDPPKNLKSGCIELGESDRKIKILVDQGNQFAKFINVAIYEF